MPKGIVSSQDSSLSQKAGSLVQSFHDPEFESARRFPPADCLYSLDCNFFRNGRRGSAPRCTAVHRGQSDPPKCVKTGQYDNARDDYNPAESVLTSGTLRNGTTLTELAPLMVDTPPPSISKANPIYAQPLYIAGISLSPNAPQQSLENCANLTVNGQPACNMLLVVTLYGSVWGYNGDTGRTIFSRLALFDDCGPNSTVPLSGQGGIGSLPFAGIVATPVIDTSLSPPAMFLTNVCLDSQSHVHWFLHEVDITNQFQDVPNSGSPLEIAGSSGGDTFSAGEVLQRPSLLEVQNPGGTPANVIYIGFGSAVPEAPNTVTGQSYPYHGWLFGYSTSGPNNQLIQDFVFNASGGGSGSATPACNTNAPLCGAAGCQPGQFENQPNWCGHGGGIWMSGRGPAASTVNGVARAFVGVGNGGYQTAASNWGSSILNFESSASGGIQATPSDSFTPHGGPNAPFTAPMLAGTNCPATLGGNPIQCPYTFETPERKRDLGHVHQRNPAVFQDTGKNNFGYADPRQVRSRIYAAEPEQPGWVYAERPRKLFSVYRRAFALLDVRGTFGPVRPCHQPGILQGRSLRYTLRLLLALPAVANGDSVFEQRRD